MPFAHGMQEQRRLKARAVIADMLLLGIFYLRRYSCLISTIRQFHKHLIGVIKPVDFLSFLSLSLSLRSSLLKRDNASRAQ